MDTTNKHVKDAVEAGRTALGIELGSTRIKAVLIGEDHTPLASGSYDWENRHEDGIWTYSLEDVWEGLRGSYQKLVQDLQARHGLALTTVGSIGISAMMHGYLAFDTDGKLLVPFRTWRNTTTRRAAEELTELFRFNIPQRWSVAHLEQAILNGEEHVPDIRFLTTLAGYVHWKLTGRRVLGVGDASGIFPIDSATGGYNTRMMQQFDQRTAPRNFPWTLEQILPQVLSAGENAGILTDEGARLLDASGLLQPGIPLCPPEGDAGTGMTATNSVAARTGNVSAGTSVFAMIVLEKELSGVYPEIDMVTTPTGSPVAMVHCNNCTSDIDAWANLFGEFAKAIGAQITKPALYDALYFSALEGDADCGGVLSYNYVSGEPITGMEEGRPLLVRKPDSRFTLSNLMRSNLFSALSTLKLGLAILFEREQVRLDRLFGHGGLFKTPRVGQGIMAAAAGVPVAVMETAGEGGAWGIAILAAYMARRSDGEALGAYLEERVFAGNAGTCMEPSPADLEGFSAYIKRYSKGLAVEKAAVDCL